MPIDWNQVRKSYLNDPTMVKLARIIQWGWPESSKDLPSDIKVYFAYRFQLHIVNGIIFLQDRIMVPIGLRGEFLSRIHDIHLGIVKSKLLARTLIYWPNWNIDVTNMCKECTICRENQAMPDNIPKYKVTASHVGEVFGIDIADIKGKPHLVCMDYKSCCIFEHPLSTLHTSDIVNALKSIFCDVGALDKIISNNAKYFVSQEFEEFTMQWAIQHVTSSPHFPHGNAHAEKAVHVVKQIYEKAEDVKLALLLLKTTPILNKTGTIYDAPATMFYGRQLKAHMPI